MQTCRLQVQLDVSEEEIDELTKVTLKHPLIMGELYFYYDTGAISFRDAVLQNLDSSFCKGLNDLSQALSELKNSVKDW